MNVMKQDIPGLPKLGRRVLVKKEEFLICY
jgi:hypothetical protein